ncbi:tyrosine-type recombinase/integrase [Atopococcus tabaci]|uniref:tyrosine-type recombinase/integrase n=1 Tax=Atopococcus tabaci TaxID=269774 RepID=UPI00240A9305|nr:site-specific integrase [Atopococcus tabaci]
MGSIEHRGGDSYRLRVVVGYYPNGNPIRKSKNIKMSMGRRTEAQLQKALQKELILFEDELEREGFTIDGDFKFQNFTENEWLPKYAEKELTYNTRELYMTYLRLYFFPSIGKRKLADITPLMIVNIMDTLKRQENYANKNLMDQPLSKSTKRNILLAVRSVFDLAVSWNLIKQNPAKGVKIGRDARTKKKSYQPYSTKEIAHIFECLQQEPRDLQIMISLALLSGARMGEIAGLEEKHIKQYVQDGQVIYSLLIEQIIIVKKDVGAVVQTHTKTDVAEEVTIPKSLYDLIQAHIKERKNLRKVLDLTGHRFLFCHPDGKPFWPSSLNQRFARFQKRHNIRKVRFHDLRHSNATYMIMEGVPMKIVQERLRHKKLSTTMDIYAHVLKEHDQVAVDTLSKMVKLGDSAPNLPQSKK